MADDFYSGIYNPDVLSCIANLSNDEVFTPPDVANAMLDLLPQEFRPVYEAQLELERETLAELLDAMEMGVMPSPSMLH